MIQLHKIGTKNVLEIAKDLKVKKVVCTTSTAGIGYTNNKNKILNENTKWLKKFNNIGYMYSKYLAEQEI